MTIKKTILHTTFFIILFSCASIKPPPGGPIDETPPAIIEIIPANGTVNLDSREITIKFSEYMDENSFKNNITIFPRIEESINYKFKGDKLILKLPALLDSNKTYIIQLNRNIKDEHGVQLAISEQLAYSTGSEISMGVINGTVYGEGQFAIHLWELKNDNKDSLFAENPYYVTDANDMGFYSFGYLAPGNYQILAVDKSNSGLPLNTERSAYGLYFKREISLSDNDTLNNIDMRMWKEPQDLKLLSGEWSAYDWGTLYFNNELQDSFSISMELIQNDNAVEYEYYLNGLDKKNLIIKSKDSLTTSPITVKIDSILYDNIWQIDTTKLIIQIPQDPDTTYLEILKPQTSLSVIPNNIDGDNIELIFSKPVELSTDSSIVPQLFIDDSVKLEIAIEMKNPMYFVIDPIAPWEQNKNYILKLNSEAITSKYGRGLKDSLQIIPISTTKRMGFGGVLGQVVNPGNENLLVELFSSKNPSLSQIADVNSESQFEFKTIPEGNYSLLFFEDSDKNMNYNFGNAYPLKTSEWFYFYPDTFEVRANWDTQLSPIKLPEIK